MFRITWPLMGVISFAVALLAIAPANASKPDTRPRQAFILPASKTFLVQDSWDSAALYNLQDASLIRKFPAGEGVNHMDVTSDERLLVIGSEGRLLVWEIATGKQLLSSHSGLLYFYDVSFSWDGKRIIAASNASAARVFDATNGKPIQSISNQFTPVLSAALSPDGSKAVFLPLAGNVHTLDVTSGAVGDTRLRGWHPLRYSADGKYVAYCGEGGLLHVIAMADKPELHDAPAAMAASHLKPQGDGSFLVTAYPAGYRYVPESKKEQELWRISYMDGHRSVDSMDFDAESLVGVCTDFNLITRVIDLKTGKVRFTVDNSANYRVEWISWTSGGGALVFWIVVGVGSAGLMLVLLRVAAYLIGRTEARTKP